MAAESSDYSGRGTRDDSRMSDLAVMDADSYKNKRRLERLLDALDNIPDQADRAREQYNQGKIDMHARRIAVQDAVQDAIWEVWNLLKDHEENCRQRAAEALIEHAAEQDEEFKPDQFNPGTIDDGTLRKAYDITSVWPHSAYFTGDPRMGKLGTIPQVNEPDIEVWGLRDFDALDELWTETWTEREKPYDLPARQVERRVNHTVPRDISWAAAVRLKEFLNDEHDMEIQFEAIPGGEAKFDYSDIIDAPTEGFDE